MIRGSSGSCFAPVVADFFQKPQGIPECRIYPSQIDKDFG
jgi:hypothetical protein